jgi:spermidine synthase
MSASVAASPAIARSERRGLVPALLVAFFLSGISGLIYQALWLRLLALVFGVTVWAATTVLASFMGGLAIGSFLAGRIADRVGSPLRWFALCELLVGATALASPLLLDAVERAYAALYPSLPQSLGAVTAVRFLFASAVLLLPTTLMGATLPLIVKSSLVSRGSLGERVSVLYGTNTAGAIAGTLLGGFYLVGGIGIAASFQLAAALNALVALIAFTVSLGGARQEAEPAGSVSATGTDRVDDQPLPAPVRRAILIVFVLSGFASLAQEVIWFRLLILFQQVTTYAFTVMLATFLAGIAAGSYLVAPLMRGRFDWVRGLAWLEIAIGVVSLLSLAALAATFQRIATVEALLGAALGDTLTLLGLASFVAVFPATLLMGVAFPIGLRLWSAGDARTGSRVGLFYSLNVLGSIGGAVAAGFVLLPLLGSRWSLVAVAGVNVLGGLLLIAIAGARRRDRSGDGLAGARGTAASAARSALLPAAAALAAFALALYVLPDPFDAVLAHRHRAESVLWREEGVQTTVSVHRSATGDRVMFLDGWPQASDNPGGVAVHRLIGHLPMVLHPDPRDALVVGLGGGATPGAVALHRSTGVDVVELSGSVIRGSDWFRHSNLDVLARPNVRLRLDDGRNHLLLGGRSYDVITADLIWPLHAGAGNLYSAEYFRLARGALRDDGLMLQWIGSRSATQYRLVTRTFQSVFPDTTLWFNGILMVGAKKPLRIDRAAFERKLQDAVLRESLASVSINDFASLLGMYRAGPEELAAFVGPGPILTDDRPMVEYYRSLPRDEPPADLRGLQGKPDGLVR